MNYSGLDLTRVSNSRKRKRASIPLRETILAALFLTVASSHGVEPCRIEVVDSVSGWPVPMIELRTLHNVRFVTDNAGVIAEDLPELMGRPTWFDILGDGYEVKKDGFGYAGFRFTPEPGGRQRIEVECTAIARCLGRVTGGGLFGESQKLGQMADWSESGVFGSDSIQNAEYRGKLFWVWGDTTLPGYPLGIFGCSGATSALRPLTTLEPPVQLRLDYFRKENGEPRGVCDMAGSGPTWASGTVSLPDAQGRERLVTGYGKFDADKGGIYRYGLAVWDDASNCFQSLRIVWEKSALHNQPPVMYDGHAVKWTDATGTAWVYLGDPFPTMRCPATFEAWQNPKNWEALRPQKTLRAAGTGEKVQPQSGMIAWNSWRKRWVTVFVQGGGAPAFLGEVWYAEADVPTGPWGGAVKILSHRNYSFYNPALHPDFSQPDSPVLIFEGTHSDTFANQPPRTPRYDYNQVLYRLDLDDPRLIPAH